MTDVRIFLTSLKLANITPVFNKGQKIQMSYQIYQKFMKGINLNKCPIPLKMSFQNFNVDLDKVSVHSIA